MTSIHLHRYLAFPFPQSCNMTGIDFVNDGSVQFISVPHRADLQSFHRLLICMRETFAEEIRKKFFVEDLKK